MIIPDGHGSTRRVRATMRRTRFGSPSWMGPKTPMWQALALGTVIALGSIVVKAGLNALLGGDTGFVVLMAAVLAAAWLAGLSAGVAATIAAVILNTVVFIAPDVGTSGLLGWSLQSLDIGRVGLYAAAGAAFSFVVASLRMSRDQLATSLEAAGRMAADIEQRDERLELVLAASGTGFWEWNVSSGALVWSQAIFEQHGLDADGEAPSSERYLETIHPDDRETFAHLIANTLESGGWFSNEFRIVWADGSIHWTHWVGRIFRDPNGEPARVVGTGQDITERHRLEDERDTLVAEERRGGAFREAFIDVISHELRTPITTILGLTQILARPNVNRSRSDEDELLADIADESERLHRLVEDLLVLTKAERGQIATEDEPMELRRLLERIVAHEAARLPSVSITADLPAGLPIVAGEVTYVEQIVRNMLGNAAKYTPPGTSVVVSASHEGDLVAIRVLDSGPGIEAEAAKQAFELFYRDPVQARAVAGSGIGLFVCASLVEAMGGSIWAKGRPEGGSEFGFTLRIIQEDLMMPLPMTPGTASARTVS